MKYGFILSTILYVGAPCSAVMAQGQNTSFNWQFEEASKLMEEKLYSQAAEIWNELTIKDPGNANLNYKLGYSYYHSFDQRKKALGYLDKAAALRAGGGGYGSFNTSGYDPFDPKERNAPADVEYYLARCYHLNGDFDKADEHYRAFMTTVDDRHVMYGAAARGLEQTANARQLKAQPLDFEVVNMGSVINGPGADFSPVLSVDGNALFFTSRRIRPDSSNVGIIDPIAGQPYENIYVSYKDRNGIWQTPELLNINQPLGHMATINVSADGQTLYIYRSDDGDGNIYESKLVGELWTDPVLMGSDINTKAWETHGALSADGNTFFFISDRKGGYGGRDIYRVVRLPNGEWSKAQNMGKTLNTKYDEDGVFIHPNGRTLYFSSVGHNSMGGFDIFMSELQDDGEWSTPTNLGYPLNTVDDDIFFITTADGRRGLFSSLQPDGAGEKDIYMVQLPTEMESEGLAVLKGFIIPPEGTSVPPSMVLYVTDKSTGEVKTYKPRQRDGVYVAILPPCREYNLDYRVEGKTIHTEDIFVECETSYQEINKEVYLNPVSLAGRAIIADLPPGSPPGGTPRGDKPKPEEGSGDGKGAIAADAKYSDEFARFYPYNAKDIDPADPRWKQFIDVVVSQIEKNGEARIVIESSASKVPTRTYGSNETLSKKRMEDARNRLVDAIKARGLDADLLKLEAVNSLVQGPRYAGDYKDTEKYGKFQYVKLKVR